MPARFTISTATVVALVALRLVIGWHFFHEGVHHYADPRWTSEPVLRAAKGPLAPLFQSSVRDFHDFERLLHNDDSLAVEHAVQAWIDQVQQEWEAYRERFARHASLDQAGHNKAQATLREYQAQLRNWASANKEALTTHVHQWRRMEQARQAASSDLPFARQRVAVQQAALAGESGGWQAELRKLEQRLQEDLDRLAPQAPRMPRDPSPIETVDLTMTWVILSVGLLLLLGLFTRAACLVGALFLLSVVMMQPFWVEGTAATYNQYVEMFALLALATTEVGRWAGLDYFLARWFSTRSTKGTSDVSQS